jgi:hypothetical protein
MPLFPGTCLYEWRCTIEWTYFAPGGLVSFDGTPAALPDDEIARLRAALSGSWRPYLILI